MSDRSLRLVAVAAAMVGTLALAPQPGRVEIGGGRSVYAECRGAGKPTVLLEAGLRTRGDVWSSTAVLPAKAKPVMAGVAAFTRVCEYDRPGTTLGTAPKDYSRSDPVPMPRSAADAMRDLHALLRAAKIPGPYVLVGHSFGGQIIRQYAATYPHEVVGLVLVDVLPEQLRPLMTVANWKTYTGLNSKPPRGLEQYKDIEIEDFDVSFAQTLRAVAASPLRAMPIVVLSKGRPFDLAGANVPAGFRNALDSDWSKAQVQLVASLPEARHVVIADSSHNIEIDRPDLVLNAIRHVVEAVRAGRDRVGETRLNPGGR